ncbi:similar to Saccharomyces cerevisiae YPL224C MMT2 Putative metal transporter involved in mitochondrial iron accumulation [Maudiozyma saulgeensis]|uniref:Similar to Saccharomyces cerevisiae YPL224C MMT2 Putative metal transporter involved in mitochondrial iron accumulation n=1 Tax=Maudiozyma saulgeensis TaxID=1789683 RepID=A0A1X7R7V9_9SACH|nr:similar to Saccharomyces cerevisiae YPL224C MMT2 Putative metal transporter involved in mitochondrial iron accumulation [Kazachstania saulgeensis]
MLRIPAVTARNYVSFHVTSSRLTTTSRVIRISLVNKFHNGSSIWNQGKNKSDITTSTSSKTNQQLHDNGFSDIFNTSNHEHIHLQESETETSDSYHLGAKNRKIDNTGISTGGLEHTHKHTHSHSEPNELLVASLHEIRKNAGVRITWVGLMINVGIALGKFVGGIVFHSQALLADSVHAASDLISDILTLVSVNMAAKKPTNEFPYGYGKIETVGSLAVSTILTMAGVSIGWTSLCAVVGPIVPHTIIETITSFLGTHQAHSHSHTAIPEGVTNINAAWIAGGSIVLKEWIFQATKKIAIRTNSNVLMANAWHHRVDSLTSFVALIAITSSHFFGISSLDALGGLVVSGLVIKAGGEGMVSSLKELIDQSIAHDDERYIKIETVIKDGLDKLVSDNNADKPYEINELTVLASGPNTRIHAILQAPIQKWDNLLGIKEMENVSDYLRTIIKKNVSNVGKIEFEFIEQHKHIDTNEKNVAK